MDVLRQLDNTILEQDMFLVSVDVESLYTCINHEDGIRATEFFLYMTNLDHDLIALLLILLRFILEHNHFTFKDK